MDFRCSHSGNVLYLSNSIIHSSCDMGGREPNTCQLVMDNPDLVKRVTPPICTMAKTSEEVDNSHLPTVACGLSVGAVRSGKPLE